jgi:hypothetical protein
MYDGILASQKFLSSSGGWGSIRGSVPYTLSGNVFSLLVPLQLIGASDGNLAIA